MDQQETLAQTDIIEDGLSTDPPTDTSDEIDALSSDDPTLTSQTTASRSLHLDITPVCPVKKSHNQPATANNIHNGMAAPRGQDDDLSDKTCLL